MCQLSAHEVNDRIKLNVHASIKHVGAQVSN